MEIYTSYFGNYRRIPSEYQCVSIANSKPQGLFIPECSLLKPYWSTVQAYKNKDISYNQFAEQYIEQLSTAPVITYFDKLKELSQFNPLVLMCWEEDYTICHRTIAAYWLTNNCFVRYRGELSNEKSYFNIDNCKHVNT